MFIGHFAVGLASKRVAPQASLGVLFAAPLLLDLLWPVFLLLGWETVRIEPGNTRFTPLAFESYPWSHSLLMAGVWALLFAGVYSSRTRYGTGAVVIGLAVLSHWVLDAVTHRPDLPLYPGRSPLLGLGLWNSVAGTLVVEGLMFAAGVWAYQSATRATDWVGRYASWALLAVLAAMYGSALVGPPPPDAKSLAVFSLGGWIFPCWAAWVDRHRETTS